jgi:RHS repeat-associated protein
MKVHMFAICLSLLLLTGNALGRTGLVTSRFKWQQQYWNGSAWVNVTGGSVSGNNKVWRKFTFAAITTSKIRVQANATTDGWSRVTELEAWTASSTGNTSANINWLVTDQLGTPRLVFDQTGGLAATKRHDYLPFGEELFAGTGGRASAQGYSVADGVRQKFTQKERDNETGFDYFGARYYSSLQGRFTSPDKPFADQFQTNPQSWNPYLYVRNSPCNNVDVNGRCSAPSGLKPGQVGICIEAFIAAKTIHKLGTTAYGDNRDFSGDDATLSARFRTQIIATPGSQKTLDITQETKANQSIAENPLSGIKGPPLLIAQGTAETRLNGQEPNADGSSQIAVPIGNDGTAKLNVATIGTNGFDSSLPVNVTGQIKLSLDLTINTKTQQVGLEGSSSATGFPSIAAYSYRNDGNKIITTEIWKHPEASLGDIKKPMQPITQVKPH